MSNNLAHDSNLAVTLTGGQLRDLIREEVGKALNGHGDGTDKLLDAQQAAKMLSVSPDWLYRHGKELPFARKLGHKMLRFSYLGIQKWLTTRKT